MTNKLIKEIKDQSNDQTYKIYANHGFDNHVGTKLSIVKDIAKREKDLPLEQVKELYLSNVLEAQHLAQYIIARSKRHNELTSKDFEAFLKVSTHYLNREFILAELIGVHNDLDIIKDWVKDLNDEARASVGLAALSYYIRNNRELNDPIINELLNEARVNIHTLPNRVKYALNGFVISVGTYIKLKHLDAVVAAKAMGHVEVYIGKTSCKVPYAYEYMQRAHDKVLRQKEAKFWHGCK